MSHKSPSCELESGDRWPPCRCDAGPMASTEHSKELEEVGSMRTPLRQNPARAGRSQRPGWRRRRPRPRLSHKGPMPF
ncbi:apelin isoform X1 [Megalobrama amblycephala]|uniref:apelin isoform X1 n=1 Tax=Megalobrama amblycephala TaxID=75352 RepID=UPI002014122C|nr:apelin isoform X1 [Megalobrama amblycephala]